MLPLRSITMNFELSAEHPVGKLGLISVAAAQSMILTDDLGFIKNLYGQVSHIIF